MVAEDPRVSESKHLDCMVTHMDWRQEDRGVKCIQKLMDQMSSNQLLLIRAHFIICLLLLHVFRMFGYHKIKCLE